MPVIDFKTIQEPSIALNAEQNDLKLMLWAGDVCRSLSQEAGDVCRVINDKPATDIERLPDYDVYLCNGYLPGLHENALYLSKRNSQAARLSYICIIDVNNQEQMDQFIRIFQSKFAVIDSDYYGNTPTLPFKYYSQLLAPGGKAYHTEGINSLRMPKEEFLNALELFAPVLTAELNEKRYWTDEIIEQGKYNDLSPSHTWASPDLKHSYYDGIRERQTKFLNCQKNRNPMFHQARGFTADNISEYWDQLPIPILTMPLINIPDEMKLIGDSYKATLATYLTRRIQATGLCDADAVAYIEEGVTNTDKHLRHCQQIILCSQYCDKINAEVNDLIPSIGYFTDVRKAWLAPIREYGVTISKA